MTLSEADLAQVRTLAGKANAQVLTVLSARQQKELEAQHAQTLMREETARLFTETVVPTIQAYVEARRSGPSYLRVTSKAPKFLNLSYHPDQTHGDLLDPLIITISYETQDAFRLQFVCDCTFRSGQKTFYVDLDMMTPSNIIAMLHQIFLLWDDQNEFK